MIKPSLCQELSKDLTADQGIPESVDRKVFSLYTMSIIRKREDRPCVRTVILGVDVEAGRLILVVAK